MFEHNSIINFQELSTKYGSIKIKTIVFEPSEIEDNLSDIIFNDVNLIHMFQEKNLDDFNRKNIYARFIPQEEPDLTLEEYIKKGIAENKNFYSFLAEGILSLVFRDIYRYELSRGVIDVSETLTYTHTGVDSCLYNIENGIIVLGEAKFYESLSGGINAIISDFKTKSIKSKLSSLQRTAQSNRTSYDIIIKNLENNSYNGLLLEQFMNQKIVFAGFVLHSECRTSLVCDESFYSTYKISTKDIEDNIDFSLGKSMVKGDYEIIMVHLPIKDKKELIAKVISSAKSKFKGV